MQLKENSRVSDCQHFPAIQTIVLVDRMGDFVERLIPSGFVGTAAPLPLDRFGPFEARVLSFLSRRRFDGVYFTGFQQLLSHLFGIGSALRRPFDHYLYGRWLWFGRFDRLQCLLLRIRQTHVNSEDIIASLTYLSLQLIVLSLKHLFLVCQFGWDLYENHCLLICLRFESDLNDKTAVCLLTIGSNHK